MKRFITLIIIAAAFLLGGCFDTDKDQRVAQGGDDYPNGVQPLGKKTAESHNDSTDWNGFKTAPKTAPGMYDDVHVPDSAPDTAQPQPKRAAAKRSAGYGGLAKRGALPGPGLPGDSLPVDTTKKPPLPIDTAKPPIIDTTKPLPADTSLPADTLVKKPGPVDTLAKPPVDTTAKAPADTGVKTGETASAAQGAGLPLPPLDTVVNKVIDTVKGTVETVHTKVTDTATHIDSTVMTPADTTKPGSKPGVMSVAGKILYPDSGRFLAYRYVDADGDGLLAPKTASARVSAQITVGLPGGITEKRTLMIAAGADLNFNKTGDNKLLAESFVRLAGADTLDVFKLLSADGDSIVIDFSKDTNLVDLVEEHHILSGGLVASVTRKVRLVVFSKDSTRNYPISFVEKRVLRDGGIVDVRARGAGSDSLFFPGDEALWSVTTFRPAGDTESADVTYRVRLGNVAGDFAADMLLGVAREEKYRKEADRFSFDFLCDAPVADGRWIGKGDIVSWLSFADGSRVTFTGTAGTAGAASGSGFAGRVTGSDGKSSAITFDAAGNVK